MTYFFFKIYLGPGLLGESVSIHQQVVDIVGGEAVGAGIHLVKPGQQQRELKRRFQTDEAGMLGKGMLQNTVFYRFRAVLGTLPRATWWVLDKCLLKGTPLASVCSWAQTKPACSLDDFSKQVALN